MRANAFFVLRRWRIGGSWSLQETTLGGTARTVLFEPFKKQLILP
jgi:hypothetical protein